MAVLITGVAGFIGSNLAAKFLSHGRTVFGLDNLCRGSLGNIAQVQSNPQFTFDKVDLSDLSAYLNSVNKLAQHEQIDEVWHLAANSDIPAGIADAAIDLRDTL